MTKNDVMRLQKNKDPVFQEAISYMPEQNCKLEKEVLDLVRDIYFGLIKEKLINIFALK